MKLRTTHYIIIVVGLFVVAGVVWGITRSQKPGSADALAQCLTEKGVKMYGAYWCPHCQNQKKLFGNSWKYIKNIECSLPGGRGQTKECNDAGIEGYPTWVFPGGLRLSGEQSFERLASVSGCDLNGGEATSSMPQDEGGTSDVSIPSSTSTETGGEIQ